MHELGVVRKVAQIAEEAAQENGIEKLYSVKVRIGEVSTIVEELFADCWNYFRVRSKVLENCELIIESVPALTYCENCGTTYPTVRYGKTCPHCGSGHTYLLQGTEVEVSEITEASEEEQKTPGKNA